MVGGSGIGRNASYALVGWYCTDAFAGGDRKTWRIQSLDGTTGDICILAESLGTFLVRSGVLTSVHAFASDPERGVFILAFLVAVVGSSLLISVRADQIKSSVRFELLSRETGLLMNNVFLVVAAIAVLLGTLYPFN